jgi:hypothetical protein
MANELELGQVVYYYSKDAFFKSKIRSSVTYSTTPSRRSYKLDPIEVYYDNDNITDFTDGVSFRRNLLFTEEELNKLPLKKVKKVFMEIF